MPFFHLRLSVLHPPASRMPDIPFWPLFTAAKNKRHYLSYSPQSFQNVSAGSKSCFSFAFPRSFRHKHRRALQSVVDVSGPSCFCKGNLLVDSKDPFQKRNVSSEARAAISPGSYESSNNEDSKEILRKRRIGLANKGKVPWNKGRPHTPETQLRIKQITFEALRNSEVKSLKERKERDEKARAKKEAKMQEAEGTLGLKLKKLTKGNLLIDSKDPFQKRNVSSEVQAAIFPGSYESSDDDSKEILRRKKIGLANKGKVPWNKGRPHTPETRLLIKQRTKEALKNPKTKKRIVMNHPGPHSEQRKARIRASCLQFWAKRRRLEQLGEGFFLSWVESVSEAARKGFTGQEELNWDSYEKMEQEMGFQAPEKAAEKVRAKEMAKLRAAVARAEKLAMLKRGRELIDSTSKCSSYW